MTLVLAALFTGVMYGVAFFYRSDYLGHFIAGFGATLLLFALHARRRRRHWIGAESVLIVLAAIFMGAITEATIFKIATFDPVDFVNQSLGATIAGAGVIGRAADVGTIRIFWALGLLSVAAGFFFAFT